MYYQNNVSNPIRNIQDLTTELGNILIRAEKIADRLLRVSGYKWAVIYRNPKSKPQTLANIPDNTIKAVIRGRYIHFIAAKLIEKKQIPGIRVEYKVLIDHSSKKFRRPDIFFKVGQKNLRVFYDIKPRGRLFGPGNKQYQDMLILIQKWGGAI